MKLIGRVNVKGEMVDVHMSANMYTLTFGPATDAMTMGEFFTTVVPHSYQGEMFSQLNYLWNRAAEGKPAEEYIMIDDAIEIREIGGE